MQDTLRPVDKYAVRWLEETGPAFDITAAVAAAAKDGDKDRADWDVDQLQALQAQQVCCEFLAELKLQQGEAGNVIT